MLIMFSASNEVCHKHFRPLIFAAVPLKHSDTILISHLLLGHFSLTFPNNPRKDKDFQVLHNQAQHKGLTHFIHSFGVKQYVWVKSLNTKRESMYNTVKRYSAFSSYT